MIRSHPNYKLNVNVALSAMMLPLTFLLLFAVVQCQETITFPLQYNKTLFYDQNSGAKSFGTVEVSTFNNGYLFHSIDGFFTDVVFPGTNTSTDPWHQDLAPAPFSNEGVPRTAKLVCFATKHPSINSDFVFDEYGTLPKMTWSQIKPLPSECQQAFSKKQCWALVVSECEWCVSNDGLDSLCFSSKHLPQKDWRCSVGNNDDDGKEEDDERDDDADNDKEDDKNHDKE